MIPLVYGEASQAVKQRSLLLESSPYAQCALESSPYHMHYTRVVQIPNVIDGEPHMQGRPGDRVTFLPYSSTWHMLRTHTAPLV